MMYYNPAGIGTNMFRFCAQTNEEWEVIIFIRVPCYSRWNQQSIGTNIMLGESILEEPLRAWWLIFFTRTASRTVC